MTLSSPAQMPSSFTRLAAAIALVLSPFHLHAKTAPQIMMAQPYNEQLQPELSSSQNAISAYYASEKLDGIRAFWNGEQLVTRTGKAIAAPDWFIESLPSNIQLDGELWAGRGLFQQVAATVLDHSPNDKQWQAIHYMVFDIPSSPYRFERRLKQLSEVIATIDRPHLQAVPQYTYTDRNALDTKLDEITAGNGEGIMLHHKDNLYSHGRSDRLLKVKRYQDAEAVVIGYEDGNGKFSGKMGALWVLTADNVKFKIGTGFNNDERENPPLIGSIINYRYNGYTDSGIPRFARFIRVRANADI
ncbi:DNA ligase [Photobacterium alginatilyticum]|uniref:DNA ligase n=1 Tax=Photobacterium alginatilyticum TaxID=1775171 RepID=UPI004067626B